MFAASNGGRNSDEEIIDDNEQLLAVPTELAGELEMVCYI